MRLFKEILLQRTYPPKPSLPWPLSPRGREGKNGSTQIVAHRLVFLPPLPLGEEGRGGEGFGAAPARRKRGEGRRGVAAPSDGTRPQQLRLPLPGEIAFELLLA